MYGTGLKQAAAIDMIVDGVEAVKRKVGQAVCVAAAADSSRWLKVLLAKCVSVLLPPAWFLRSMLPAAEYVPVPLLCPCSTWTSYTQTSW